MRSIILLSGGLDSAVCLAMIAPFHDVTALTFRYGQRHSFEVECAKKLAAVYGVKDHRIIDLDLASFGGSSLVGDGDIPTGESARAEGILSTYVPCRNLIFIAIAAALAESIGADRVIIGAHEQDASGYPDCRAGFIDAVNLALQTGTKRGVEGMPIRVEAPLLLMTKTQIVEAGRKLALDFDLTSSCYQPNEDGKPCGSCPSCLLRDQAMEI